MSMEKRLGDLSRAKAWLDQLRPLPEPINSELRHLFEVRLTHHSTAIEGNTLTQSETEVVLSTGITIDGKSLRDHLEVVGHKEALDFVLELADSQSPLGALEIREMHSLVMKGQGDQERGAYRTLDVRAAGTEHVYPGHFQVPELMDEFVEWLRHEPKADHPVVIATRAHYRFVEIHPFRDGNGRVGRLLLNLLLVRAGYPIAVIPVQSRSAYIDALVQAQSGGGLDAVLELVCQAVESSLRDTLSMCATYPPFVSGDLPFWTDLTSWLSD